MKIKRMFLPLALIATAFFSCWNNVSATNADNDIDDNDSIPTDTTTHDSIPEAVIPVTSISISPANASIYQQDAVSFTASVEPESASDKSIKWSVVEKNTSDLIVLNPSDNSVTVSAPLTVTPDTYKIVATSADGTVSDTCELTVLERAKRITLSRMDITIVPGETADNIQAFLTYYDGRTTAEGIAWEIPDEDIAVISAPNEITGVSPGWTRVNISGGGLSLFGTIHVCEPIEEMHVNPEELTMEYGQTQKLTVSIVPQSSMSLPVRWSIEPAKTPNVSIDTKGNLTTTHNPSGIDTPKVVYAVASAGLSQARCKVNIVVPVTAISLSPTQLSINEGETGDITATMTPEGSVDVPEWESSDASIASVSTTTVENDGPTKVVAHIDGHKAGTCVMTAKIGDISSICLVTVVANQAGINEVQIDADAECDVFNLDGTVVSLGTSLSAINSQLSPGTYIIKIGDKSHKVMIGK